MLRHAFNPLIEAAVLRTQAPHAAPAMYAAVLPCAMLMMLIAAAPGVLADKVASGCSALVPNLNSVNQEPSDPANYGRCTKALDPQVLTMGSNWCAFNDMGAW